jgi:hypothetical protein
VLAGPRHGGKIARKVLPDGLWISLAASPKATIMWEIVEKVAKSGEKWGKRWITI